MLPVTSFSEIGSQHRNIEQIWNRKDGLRSQIQPCICTFALDDRLVRYVLAQVWEGPKNAILSLSRITVPRLARSSPSQRLYPHPSLPHHRHHPSSALHWSSRFHSIVISRRRSSLLASNHHFHRTRSPSMACTSVIMINSRSEHLHCV